MFNFSDKIGRFLHLQEERENAEDASLAPEQSFFNKLIGTPEECLIFHRPNGIEDMESEDDEIYIFCTPDQLVSETFSRFQAPKLLAKLGFSEDRIDLLFKLIWNYNALVINTKTKQFEVYSGFSYSPLSIIDLSTAGTFKRKITFIE